MYFGRNVLNFLYNRKAINKMTILKYLLLYNVGNLVIAEKISKLGMTT